MRSWANLFQVFSFFCHLRPVAKPIQPSKFRKSISFCSRVKFSTRKSPSPFCSGKSGGTVESGRLPHPILRKLLFDRAIRRISNTPNFELQLPKNIPRLVRKFYAYMWIQQVTLFIHTYAKLFVRATKYFSKASVQNSANGSSPSEKI